METYSGLAEKKRAFEPLTGDGVRLRLLQANDLPATLAWRNRDDIRRQFIHSDIIAWDQHVSWFEGYKSKNNDFVFIIEETGPVIKPVGQIALYHIDLEKGEAELGRLMIGDNTVRGKGYAKRATKLVLSWAFFTVGLQRVYLEVFKTNTTATNLYEGNGFVICGERENLYIMQIIKENFIHIVGTGEINERDE